MEDPIATESPALPGGSVQIVRLENGDVGICMCVPREQAEQGCEAARVEGAGNVCLRLFWSPGDIKTVLVDLLGRTLVATGELPAGTQAVQVTVQAAPAPAPVATSPGGTTFH